MSGTALYESMENDPKLDKGWPAPAVPCPRHETCRFRVQGTNLPLTSFEKGARAGGVGQAGTGRGDGVPGSCAA